MKPIHILILAMLAIVGLLLICILANMPETVPESVELPLSVNDEANVVRYFDWAVEETNSAIETFGPSQYALASIRDNELVSVPATLVVVERFVSRTGPIYHGQLVGDDFGGGYDSEQGQEAFAAMYTVRMVDGGESDVFVVVQAECGNRVNVEATDTVAMVNLRPLPTTTILPEAM